MAALAVVTHPAYSFPFPGPHRFPMEKFGLLAEYAQAQGYLARMWRPGRIRRELLELAHDSAYLDRFIHGQLSAPELRRLGLPWSEALVRRTLIAPNGTLLTAHLALADGIACHLAGGTHHAHRDHGAGFCIVNDLAVCALALLAQGKVRRVLIFDCDVHQGDGTARILAAEPRVFTCSVHCGQNFPVRKALSDLDVEVPRGAGDEAYLAAVQAALELSLARFSPDLVLYDAGVDVHHADPLGLLKVSGAGIFARDHWVLSRLRQAGLPVATVIGGGYDDDRRALARRHALVVDAAHTVHSGRPPPADLNVI